MDSLYKRLASAVEQAIHQAETVLPPDVEEALHTAYDKETNVIARGEYENIFANLRVAKEKDVPICQDTGIFVIYLTLPETVPLTTKLYDAVSEGIRLATKSVPLRPNAVDPVSRKNSRDNTGAGIPAIHIIPGDKLLVTVLPKGAGSENMSQIKMLLPSEVGKIPEFVISVVKDAGSRPCPPVIVGVGIGGTFDSAASFAKEALLSPINVMTPFEKEICGKINELGIGAMGLGGDTTCLAVKIKQGACHTASLPVAVNIQCWCSRRGIIEVEV